MAEAGMSTLREAAAASEGDSTAGTLKVGDKELSGQAAVEALLEGGKLKKQKHGGGQFPAAGNPGGGGARVRVQLPPPLALNRIIAGIPPPPPLAPAIDIMRAQLGGRGGRGGRGRGRR
jgi:hypothetical protein